MDTGDWSIRTLAPRPNLMDVAGDTLLANGTLWSAGFRRSWSSGLLAFDAAGERRFTRSRGKDIAVIGSRGRIAYVWVRPDRTLHAVDLRGGRTIATKLARPSRIPFFLTPRG